jgi:alkylhydroperoxidase family enzyme
VFNPQEFSAMPRIPYVSDEEAGPPELVAAIHARRGGPLIELDRMLLHSAPFATGWSEMMSRVRTQLALAPIHLELVMCAVAALNGAAYEMHHHAPLFLKAGGTPAQLDALGTLPASLQSGVFDDTQRAVLQLTIESTRPADVRAGRRDRRLQHGVTRPRGDGRPALSAPAHALSVSCGCVFSRCSM